jgi:hypothetical protein
LGLGTLGVILGYAPFYFPGSYPGAGARFFADALPLEHALVGLALVRLELSRFLPGATLLGFALHGVHAHEALRARDGGRPMYEPSVVERAGVTAGLVFVSTDHGFSLGHDPGARDPHRSLVVARHRDAAHDYALFRALGSPSTFRYDYSATTGRAALRSYVPEHPDPFRVEAESEWPPLAVDRGWAHPDYGGCLSAGRGLHLRGDSGASVTIELVAPEPGTYHLDIGWLADPGAVLEVTLGGRSTRLTAGRSGCARSPIGRFSVERGQTMRVSASRNLLLDYVDLGR